MTLYPEWPVPARVRAAFTTRVGGVSIAPYESMNVGAHVGDASDAVVTNRQRLREELKLPSEPVWLQQVHGTDVVDLDAIVESARADASVTRTSSRVCVIQVADCMPVLFASRDGAAVGAAHAGWRGLAGGVLEQTVRALGVPASHLLAWMGPTISQANFEVGDDVRAAFISGDPGAASAFVANTRGRWQCDLYALAKRRLTALGINEVFGGGWCTYADSSQFFSFRRDGQCGRMVALIWLEPGSL